MQRSALLVVPMRIRLGSQPSGASTDVTFREAGDVQAMCAIHPLMMTVKVVD